MARRTAYNHATYCCNIPPQWFLSLFVFREIHNENNEKKVGQNDAMLYFLNHARYAGICLQVALF